MSKLIFWCLVIAFSFSVNASKVGIKPIDCGPLARGEYGAVFYTLTNDIRTTYFVKASASDVCPKLLTGKLISGYDIPLNKPELFTDNELKTIKEFVVISYGK